MTQNSSKDIERNMKRGQHYMSKPQLCVFTTQNNSIFKAFASRHISYCFEQRKPLVKRVSGCLKILIVTFQNQYHSVFE